MITRAAFVGGAPFRRAALVGRRWLPALGDSVGCESAEAQDCDAQDRDDGEALHRIPPFCGDIDPCAGAHAYACDCGATSYPDPPSCTNAPLTAQCEGPSETPRPPTCGGLRAEAPERTVAQPLRIALAILGKLYDGLGDRRRPRVFAVGQGESGQRGLECRRQVGNVFRTKRVVVFEDRSDRHVQPCNRLPPPVRGSIFYRGGVKA